MVAEKSVLIPTAHDEPAIHLNIFSGLFHFPVHRVQYVRPWWRISQQFSSTRVPWPPYGFAGNIPMLRTSVLALLVITAGIAAVYEHSQVFAAGNSLYQGIKPALPTIVRREVTGRLVDLHRQFSTRMRLITPSALYLQRIRDWNVPLAVIKDYPGFGIGVGAFYRNSLDYAKGPSATGPTTYTYFTLPKMHTTITCK